MNVLEGYTIQALTDDRLQEALDLVWKVFSEFEAPDYSAEGIAEFRRFIQPESIQKSCAEGMRIWLCICNGAVVGLIALRQPAHVSLLFVDKAHHRKGVARGLCQAAVETCGEHEVTVNSSPYAREAYRRLGFTETGPEQTVNGLRFTPMVHRL